MRNRLRTADAVRDEMLLKRLQARGRAAVHLHASENFRQQIQIAEGVLGSVQDALEWLSSAGK